MLERRLDPWWMKAIALATAIGAFFAVRSCITTAFKPEPPPPPPVYGLAPKPDAAPSDGREELRTKMARILEGNHLRNGLDITFTTRGDGGKVLRMRAADCARPVLYQWLVTKNENGEPLFRLLSDGGFVEVECENSSTTRVYSMTLADVVLAEKGL